MPLPTTGLIEISDLLTEFGLSDSLPNTPLTKFYRGKGTTPNTPTNITVSTGQGTGAATKISLEQFRGASKYTGTIRFGISNETTSQYANANNGAIVIVVGGFANGTAVTATLAGITGITSYVAGGSVTITFSGLNATWYNLSVTDPVSTNNYAVYVGYGSGGLVTGYALGVDHPKASYAQLHPFA